MEVRKVKKEVMVNEYVARDGRVFSNENDCKMHEGYLDWGDLIDWLDEHCLAWNDDSLFCYITHCYPEESGIRSWTIKATDEAIERVNVCCADDLEEYKDQLVILTAFDDYLCLWGTMQHLADCLENDCAIVRGIIKEEE